MTKAKTPSPKHKQAKGATSAKTPTPTHRPNSKSGAATEGALPKGKIATLIDLLSRPGGAVLQDMMMATGWQAHSVRGALSGAIKKDRGVALTSEKTEAGRVYRIAENHQE